MPSLFSENDIRRIAKSVLMTEKHNFSRPLVPGRWFPSGGVSPLFLLRATDDIANGDSAICNKVTLSGATPTEDADTTHTVYNVILPKIWNDCYLVASNVGGELIALWAYSATIIWGQLTAACSGSFFAIDGVKGLDGEYPAGGTISSIQNPFEMTGDDNGEVIIQWDDDTGAWMGIQMECPA